MSQPLNISEAPKEIRTYIKGAAENGVEIHYYGRYKEHALLGYGSDVPRADDGSTQYDGYWGVGLGGFLSMTRGVDSIDEVRQMIDLYHSPKAAA